MYEVKRELKTVVVILCLLDRSMTCHRVSDRWIWSIGKMIGKYQPKQPYEPQVPLVPQNSTFITSDWLSQTMVRSLSSDLVYHTHITALIWFKDIYFLGIGRACPDLYNLAFSSIAEFEPVGQLCDKWFNQLHALELWSDPHADLSPNLIRQLLLFSPNMTNMLFKGCEVLSDKLMAGIWEVSTGFCAYACMVLTFLFPLHYVWLYYTKFMYSSIAFPHCHFFFWLT